jgi:hypothetical protein
LIVEAVNTLKVRPCLIDGEAVVCDDNGLAVIDLLCHKARGTAFDLLELNGKDLHRNEDRSPTHGFEPTREVAMAAFHEPQPSRHGHHLRHKQPIGPPLLEVPK